ncbi:MAG: BspA family leucine-rich repeat surface protein [Bacilli bacterium]|nr:BspA family leucine-rich repeat surface protein [Bacilli bacterium]
MKKVFNLYNITLILVVALVGVLTFKTMEVKAAGTVNWPDGSTATISRTIQNVYNAPVVDFTYSISTEDTSLIRLATFNTGTTVNGIMKTLANGSTKTYSSPDTAIKSIKKAGSLPSGFVPTAANTVSVANSEFPIYIFFDSTDGTMYYYSEADKIYLNSSSANMFRNMQGLMDISGLSLVDASKTTNTSWMFAYCSQLSSVDATSAWDLSNVTTMSAMFIYCSSLTSINSLSDWNTSKVTNMGGMFDSCSSLSNINSISNWDTSRVTNVNNMFNGCTNASGTIQILANPTNYSGAFTNAATQSGTQISVNYGSGTSNIDNIIATKSAGSNVIKGSQVSSPSQSPTFGSGIVFYTQDISFAGTETVSNSYTVNKSTTINFANMGLSFKKPGNYELTVKETATSNSAYPVDNDNEYTVIVQVTNVTDQNGTPTGNFNAKFVIKDDNDTKVSNMPFNEPKDETKFGHIELTKTVKGIMADRTKDFSFSVQVDDAASSACQSYSGSEKYLIKGTGVPEDGSEVTKCKSGTKDSITLNHGETATIGQFTYNNNTYDSISIDDYYKIIEGTESDYTTTFKINSGSESSGNDTGSNSITHNGNVVNFYNQREGSPVTGLFLTILPYLILVGIGVGGVLLFQNREKLKVKHQK